METVQCHLTKADVPLSESYKGSELRQPLLQMIQKDYPDFTPDKYVSTNRLNEYRRRYITQLIAQENGEVNQLEQEVINSIQNNKILSENIEEDLLEKTTFGQSVADNIASFGGSWTFIIIFFSFLLLWMLVNIWLLSAKPFDPYPFILLNLILSCLAAIQAPIIMMSQNRAEARDRLRAENDYKVNLKAELEIRHLHEKIDHLLRRQYNRLFEIQQMQIDLLEELTQRRRGSTSHPPA